MQQSPDIEQLFGRYLNGDVSSQEIRLLLQLFDAAENEVLLREQVSRQIEHPQADNPAWQPRIDAAYRELSAVLSKKTKEASTVQGAPIHRVHFLRRGWLRYAAAVIVIIGAASLWYIRSNKTEKPTGSETVAQATGIAPGSNRATLTIGNDSTINLSNHKTGISIASNAVTYNDGERIADAGQQLTLTTPRGGQYQATLPDGSKVWLNAASSIQFPSTFTGDRREVEVSGEVYLEVAKNTKQPFYVRTGKAEIQVLGTSFNVNAYGDEEAEKTTLIEGSIRVAGRSVRYDQGVILKPGQQAAITGLGGHYDQNQAINVSTSDIEQVLAWKNGIFKFNNTSLDDIMRQLARWYNLDIVYKSQTNKTFTATIPRDLPLAQVLDNLTLTQAVHFTIRDRTIIVQP